MRDRRRDRGAAQGALHARSRAGASSRAMTRPIADFLVYRPEPKARRWSIFRTQAASASSARRRARKSSSARSRGRRAQGRRRSRSARSRSSSSVIGLFGGAFDPPHNGHVALARARDGGVRARPTRVVIVAADPGHKAVETPAPVRLELARAAFPDETVVLDDARPDDRDAARRIRSGRRPCSCSAPTSSPGSSAGRSPRRCCASSARRRDAAGLPAREPRRRARAARASRARLVLRARAACRSPPASSASASTAATT